MPDFNSFTRSHTLGILHHVRPYLYGYATHPVRVCHAQRPPRQRLSINRLWRFRGGNRRKIMSDGWLQSKSSIAWYAWSKEER